VSLKRDQMRLLCRIKASLQYNRVVLLKDNIQLIIVAVESLLIFAYYNFIYCFICLFFTYFAS